MKHLDPENPIRLSGGECRLVVVQDQLQACPYLETATARMPLRLPVGTVTPEVTDHLLELGYRRSGDFVYRAQCPACNECKPTRVIVDRFQISRSFRRVLNRGDRELTFRWGLPSVDRLRIEMFNAHRHARALGSGEDIDADSYRAFLADTCCETKELAVYKADQLIAVSIIDIGSRSTSAVYTHFDPAASHYSLGTLAVLKQIQWAQRSNRKFVYLGMYVAANRHLNYKARFTPQQRLCDGKWVDIVD